MCTRDHQFKTISAFTVTQPEPGIFEWTTPTGHVYRRDRDGTTTMLPARRTPTPAGDTGTSHGHGHGPATAGTTTRATPATRTSPTDDPWTTHGTTDDTADDAPPF